MALSPAPHPPSVFRYLKQAWRDFLGTGGGPIVTVTTPPTQAAANPLTVSGTVQADVSVPRPILVTVTLTQASLIKGTSVAAADVSMGAWTTTFPGATLAAGTATATAATPYPPAVSTPAFTLT
jgi:hypothetical protein